VKEGREKERKEGRREEGGFSLSSLSLSLSPSLSLSLFPHLTKIIPLMRNLLQFPIQGALWYVGLHFLYFLCT
jgi:hypothetical protein